jgi:hypothetical protein
MDSFFPEWQKTFQTRHGHLDVRLISFTDSTSITFDISGITTGRSLMNIISRSLVDLLASNPVSPGSGKKAFT